jgi:hypothetical protein
VWPPPRGAAPARRAAAAGSHDDTMHRRYYAQAAELGTAGDMSFTGGRCPRPALLLPLLLVIMLPSLPRVCCLENGRAGPPPPLAAGGSCYAALLGNRANTSVSQNVSFADDLGVGSPSQAMDMYDIWSQKRVGAAVTKQVPIQQQGRPASQTPMLKSDDTLPVFIGPPETGAHQIDDGAQSAAAAAAAAVAAAGGYSLTSLTGDCKSASCTGALHALDGDGLYGKPIPKLKLQAMAETTSRLHLKFTDASRPRWEPPGILRQPEAAWQRQPGTAPHLFELHTSPVGDGRFGFAVSRPSADATLFNCTGLVFKDRFLSIGTVLEKGDVIYGIGQHARSTLGVLPGTYTLWNHDEGQRANMYGSHPFYMVLRSDGTSHGVFLLNSNAMDIVVAEDTLTFRVVGGVLDLYVFAGPSAREVVRQYHSLVGFPVLPPYWGLGFHQCRWGFLSTSHTRSVVQGYVDASIPLDVLTPANKKSACCLCLKLTAI